MQWEGLNIILKKVSSLSIMNGLMLFEPSIRFREILQHTLHNM